MNVRKNKTSVSDPEHWGVIKNKTTSGSHPEDWCVIILQHFNDVVCFCKERHGVK